VSEAGRSHASGSKTSPSPRQGPDRSEGVRTARRAVLVDHLLRHALRRGRFVLKSGRTSEWFLDVKQSLGRPEGMLLVAEAILEILPSEVTALGGLTMGADPIAFGTAALGAARGRPLRSFSVRKEAKDHGPGGRIAGVLEPTDLVVVVEDATTRGESLAAAAEAVAAVGAKVLGWLAVVDRGGVARARAEAEGVQFWSLVDAPDLGLPYDLGEGALSARQGRAAPAGSPRVSDGDEDPVPR
jgi:orotate phosphoribosyltransferase